MKKLLVIYLCFFIPSLTVLSQNTEARLQELITLYEHYEEQRDSISYLLEEIKIKRIVEKLHEKGMPELAEGEVPVCHSAMCLVFSDEHMLAKWVVHIITGDIIKGRVSRTNDFRNDPKIPNTGLEQDYFLKFPQADGKVRYDGFGYDRGHLAPSADFRWSEKALSESYYYSNITPQTPEFNRGKWAEVEDLLRTYIYNNPKNELYIVTAPVLQDNLPRIERGVNQLPIPQWHYKIAVDFEQKIGIAFLMPQTDITYPISSYVVSIDSIESLTGINFYPHLNQEEEKLIEATFDLKSWIPEKLHGDVNPVLREDLPPGSFNTVEALKFVNYHREVKVCGKVVSAHKSGKGNVFLNLDKAFPNQIFSVTIWAKDMVNFDYQPQIYLLDKNVCVTGKITEYQGTPSMYLSNDKKIDIIR